MEEVLTQMEDTDLHERILLTLESVSEYNIFESEKIVVPDDIFENKDLPDSRQCFDFEPAVTDLPEPIFHVC